jgi:hypothetical protein
METNLNELKLRAEAQLRQIRAEREKKVKDYWQNELQKFVDPNDVPDLPKVDEDEWREFYVPKLIELGAIPKKDLIHGQVYIGKHRNANVQRWNHETNRFDHMRFKFGWREDVCNHFEDDDGFALFVPIRLGTEDDWNDRLK